MRVAVLSGGRSSEHQISLDSGASVAEGLRAAGHDVIPVLLGRDGRWTVCLVCRQRIVGRNLVRARRGRRPMRHVLLRAV